MNSTQIGRLIRQLRLEKGMTQAELAGILHVSNKTVSKWECGSGCPELSIFPALSAALDVNFSALFCGKICKKVKDSGNLRRLQYYICPQCGNLVTATSSAGVSCCGRPLPPQTPQRAGEELSVEPIGREYRISSGHEMCREHYITFVALCSSEQILLRKLYPEWDLQLWLPYIPGAVLIWHCSQHGLFYQPLPQQHRADQRSG